MKKLKQAILFSIILQSTNVALAQKCNCSLAFQWMKITFEENDAGFRYILDQKGNEAYDAHNQLFEKKVSSITNPDSCVSSIRQWAKFFRVGHFGFIVNRNADEKKVSLNAEKSTRSANITLLDDSPFVRDYDSTTTYFRVPTFDSRYKKAIDSIIHSNNRLIYSRKNLIIDIRDNGGGDDASFDEILPIFYTNPIRNVSVARLSTHNNNKIWQDFISRKDLSETNRTIYAGFLEKLNANLGKFVVLRDSVYITHFGNVTQFPQNVAIIINEKNGSTAEQFILAARQSKKVKLFGTTTMGELDISNMYSITSPDGKYTLWYCISKSLRVPEYTIDNKGISPDFFLDKSISKNEWLPYVAQIIHSW